MKFAVILVVGGLLAAACSQAPNTGTGDMARPATQAGTVPSTQAIGDSLHRILGFMDQAMPMRVIFDDSIQGQDRPRQQPLSEPDWAEASGAHWEITDFSNPVSDATVDCGYGGNFSPLHYCSGVTYAGMLSAADATGDPAFSKFVGDRLQFIHDRLPYFEGQATLYGLKGNAFITILDPESLDAAGAMCAAMIKARRAGVGPDMSTIIQSWIDFIENKQYRLADGTLARKIPLSPSVWVDDTYMGAVALAQMGSAAGSARYMNDAAAQVLHFSHYLFDPAAHLYRHGVSVQQDEAPAFHWARGNGWAVMATEEVLDVLPANHPQRAAILELLRDQLHGIASVQASDGLWHQILDRPDSYTETSSSAMFVYAIAHAINKGWIAPVGFGSVAEKGWDGLAARIDDMGRVHGTCISTALGSDLPYYYDRPTSAYAPHGYGPMLLAGAEMIRLLENPKIDLRPVDGDVFFAPQSN